MTIRIVGIVLVQDEENFITWAIGNAIEFCDEILVIDNLSRDATPARLAALAARHSKIRLIRESNPLRTNAFVQPYIGKDVWVFGLDGDEIYDPAGLARLRRRLLAGAYADHWSVSGHSVHATRIDLGSGVATGYATPAAAPATKLYNFAIIESWHENTQRLHGSPVLKPGYDLKKHLGRAQTESWEDCDLRNVHLCFFPRSRRNAEVEIRKNITDRSFRNVVRRPLFRALQSFGLAGGQLGRYLAPRATIKKFVRYMRGDLEERQVGGFGRPADYADLDPDAAATEAMLAAISARRIAEPDLRPSALQG